MDIKFSTVLYSKFSETSQNFINMLSKLPDDLKSNLSFNILSVDNPKIRKTILQDKNLNIKNVPCLLIVYNDSRVEKYEGSDAFRWIEEILTKINLQKQKEELELQQKMLEQQALEQQRLLQQQQKEMEEQNEHEHEDEEEVIKKPKKKPVKKKKQNTKPVTNKSQYKTSIDDLDDLDELEMEDRGDIQEDFEYEPSSDRNSEPKNAMTEKKESLMSAALAMQKTRENLDESNKRQMF